MSRSFSLAFLEQHRANDDDAGQHEPGLLADGVDAEDLLEVADDEDAEQRSARWIRCPPRQAGAADDHHGDGGELVGAARLGVALQFLRRLADAGHGAEEAAEAVGEQLVVARTGMPGEPGGLFVPADGIEVPAPRGAGKEQYRTGAETDDQHERDDGEIVAGDPWS